MRILKLFPLPFFVVIFLFFSTTYTFAQGNVDVEATVAAPTVTITNPADGATVSGIVNVTANANDAAGIAKVEFYVDGLIKLTDTSAPYNFSWDTSTVTNGSHTLTAKAYDVGNDTASDTITVTVNNVTMTSPTKKLTPLAPITPVPEKPKQEAEKERKFLIFPNLPGIGLAEAPIDFFRANSNFFFGFLFALELLLLYWIVKKLRERRKKKRGEDHLKQQTS